MLYSFMKKLNRPDAWLLKPDSSRLSRTETSMSSYTLWFRLRRVRNSIYSIELYCMVCNLY